MKIYIAKIEKRKSQLRITIPIKLAKVTKIWDCEFVKIENHKINALEVTRIDFEKDKER